MKHKSLFDWNELRIGEPEDASLVKARLEGIHRDILKSKGIDTKPGKNSPGFNPTVAQAREVAVMSCLGLQAKDIALVLNIELPLLKFYYTKELTMSHNIANAMVARVALQMAASGTNADMTKFWLKCQAGWQEKQAIDITTQGKAINNGSAKQRLKDALNAVGKVG